MKTTTCLIAVLVCPLGSVAPANEAEFVPLCNGKDLSGWVNVNCAPSTWTVVDGMIHCNGKPTGALRTERQYENFVMEFEWRHLKAGGNAGLFVWAGPISAPGQPFLRAVEVQILENAYGNTASYTTHGDVFPIHGSSMKPFAPSRGSRSFPKERRSKPSPQWNHYRVTCNKGELRLAVNGAEVSGGTDCIYRKGYIALESEGGIVDYRNLRIQELPSSGATAEQTAPLHEGFEALYTGVDFSGWKHTEAHGDHWKSRDWFIESDGKGAADAQTLWCERVFKGDFTWILDYHWKNESETKAPLALPDPLGKLVNFPSKGWTRLRVRRQGSTLHVSRGESNVVGSEFVLPLDAIEPMKIGLRNHGAAVEIANIYAKDQ